MLNILVAVQTQGEVRSVVRSQFDHLSQLHWIADIHPSGIIFSVVLPCAFYKDFINTFEQHFIITYQHIMCNEDAKFWLSVAQKSFIKAFI